MRNCLILQVMELFKLILDVQWSESGSVHRREGHLGSSFYILMGQPFIVESEVNKSVYNP